MKRGRINSDDIGICQINQKYWTDDARRLGLDLFREEDNLAMAVWIYEHYGIRPWKPSGFCWVDNETYDELYQNTAR